MSVPRFIGWQELPPGIGGGKMALFNLAKQLGPHPAGSTVSDRTLLQYGWSVVQVAALITDVFKDLPAPSESDTSLGATSKTPLPTPSQLSIGNG